METLAQGNLPMYIVIFGIENFVGNGIYYLAIETSILVQIYMYVYVHVTESDGHLGTYHIFI